MYANNPATDSTIFTHFLIQMVIFVHKTLLSTWIFHYIQAKYDIFAWKLVLGYKIKEKVEILSIFCIGGTTG